VSSEEDFGGYARAEAEDASGRCNGDRPLARDRDYIRQAKFARRIIKERIHRSLEKEEDERDEKPEFHGIASNTSPRSLARQRRGIIQGRRPHRFRG